MGSIYRRGETLWIKYYRNGKAYRESAKSAKEKDARRLLKTREGEIAAGRIPGIYFDKVRFDELAEDYLTDYQFNKHIIHHVFCKRCGIKPFARGTKPDGQAMVAINVRCLDDIDVFTVQTKQVNGKAV